MNQPAAGERAVRKWALPNGIEISLLIGYYHIEGQYHEYPIKWRAQRGGRVCDANNPITAVIRLLKFEKVKVPLQ